MSESIPAGAVEATTETIEPFEGFSPVPYPDPISGNEPWNIGFGSTIDLQGNPITKDTLPITRQQGLDMLSNNVRHLLVEMASVLKVRLTIGEWSAIGSLTYNIGLGNFDGSTLLKLLNDKDYEGAAKQILLWDHAGGKVVAGLVQRRQKEEAKFEAGIEENLTT